MDLDGSPLKLWMSVTMVARNVETSACNICSAADHFGICNGYAWVYSAFKEVIYNVYTNRGLPATLLKRYPYLSDPCNHGKVIDLPKLRESQCLSQGSLPYQTIWKIDFDGTRLQKFWGAMEAFAAIVNDDDETPPDLYEAKSLALIKEQLTENGSVCKRFHVEHDGTISVTIDGGRLL